MNFKWALIPIVIVLGVVAAICCVWVLASQPTGPGSPGGLAVRAYSPDGSVYADVPVQVWNGLQLPGPEPAPVIKRRADLRWCSIANPAQCRRIELATATPAKGSSSAYLYACIKFSPDSRHLAVCCQGKLSCVDLASGERRAISNESDLVLAFAWLDAQHLGYGTRMRWITGGAETGERVFWRQAIDVAASQAQVIYRQDGVDRAMGDSDYEHYERWSPGGRYVLMTCARSQRSMQLLDAQSGAVTPVGKPGFRLDQTAWKPDDSAVFCFSQDSQDASQFQALLVEPSHGVHIADLTPQFVATFEKAVPPEPAYIEQWTADGRYLIVNRPAQGGWLLQARPWRAFELAPQGQAKECAYGLPVPGYVRQVFDAVDYTGKVRFTGITDGMELSPDGKWRATYGGDTVGFTAVNLPVTK